MASHYRDFAAFWPYYLRQHSKPATRAAHIVATSLAVVGLAGSLYRIGASASRGHFDLSDLECAGSGIAAAYAIAWISHFAIEKNAPATFEYPLLSFRADIKMLGLALRGELEREVKHAAQRDGV